MPLWRILELHSRLKDVTDVNFAIEVEEKLVARILMCLSDKFPFLDPSHHLNTHFETKINIIGILFKIIVKSLYNICYKIYVTIFDFWIKSVFQGSIKFRGTKKYTPRILKYMLKNFHQGIFHLSHLKRWFEYRNNHTQE